MIIAKNKITFEVLFNFGLVTSNLPLNCSYHNLYPRYDTPKLIMEDNIAISGLYPLIKSHKKFPITDPIAPYGPHINPEINSIPK